MIEALSSPILGGLLGGMFRLVPEILKHFDRKNEREHELKMQDKMLEYARLTGQMKVEEIKTKGEMEFDLKGLEALIEAIRGQEQPTGVKWIDGLSKLMRPLITLQWVVFLYPAIILSGLIITLRGSDEPLTITNIAMALRGIFGETEKAICAGIINFWFLDRVLKWRR